MTCNVALLKSFTHNFQHMLTMLLTLPATVGCCHMMNVVDMALESAETTHLARNVYCLQNLRGFPDGIVFRANLCLENIITHHILIVFVFRYRQQVQTYSKCSIKTITVTLTLFLLSRALCNKRRHIKSIHFYIYKTEIQFMLKRKQAERWYFIV